VLVAGLSAAVPAASTELTVYKARRELLFVDGPVRRTFRIGLGRNPVGMKTREGDRRTPEGVYYVTHLNPNSAFTLSIGVSYPNSDDAGRGLASSRISPAEHAAIVRAHARGRLPPQHTALGGEIFLHGGGSHADWTWGCIALDDADIRFLFARVKPGDRITIWK
jgi:murein L,D-transpeptidase YafK